MASETTSLINSYALNLGTYTEFYNQVQIDTTGGLKKFDSAPVLGAGLEIPFTEKFQFLPEVNWVLPRKTGDRILKNIFIFGAHIGHRPLKWLRLRAGTSIVWTNQQGTGGEEVINNGNSTSTFYYPAENRSSFNNTLDLGVEFLIKQIGLRLQTYTFSLFQAERRQISYSLFLSYYWGR